MYTTAVFVSSLGDFEMNNSTDSTWWEHIDSPAWFNWMLTTLMIFLAMASAVGNGLVLLSYNNFHSIRSNTTLLITSMAVSDLLAGVVFILHALLYSVHLPAYRTLCSVVVKMEMAICYLSLLHLLVLNIERYLYIAQPFVYARWITSRCIGFTIFGIYLAIFILTIITLQTETRFNLTSNCVASPVGIDVIGEVVLAFFVPLFIIVCLAIGLYRIVIKQSRAISAQSEVTQPRGHSDSTSESVLQNRRIIQVIASILLTFIITWSPMIVSLIVFDLLDDELKLILTMYIIPLAILFIALNSVINLVLYPFIYPQYRKPYKQLLVKITCC